MPESLVSMGAPNESTRLLIERLRHRVISATLTPMDEAGSVNLEAIPHYVSTLADAGVGGLAVWAHTGRGPYLTESQQEGSIRAFRDSADLPLIAGVGTQTRASAAAEEIVADYRTVAYRAAVGGADGLLVMPPRGLQQHPDREQLFLDLHEKLARDTGLPLVLFVLYEAAGGFPLSVSLLRALLSLPHAVGLKLATLDSAMQCQDIIWLIREEFPDRLAITGEDRMFGPSLTWGANSALVGIASAVPELSVALLRAWFHNDVARFLELSAEMDQLARRTFRAPMEGYIQRMHWLAAATGALAPVAAHDPHGPKLASDEQDHLTGYTIPRHNRGWRKPRDGD